MTHSIYDYSVKSIDGETVNLEQFRGKVLLIVNTASKCGFTPQYEGLERLYQEFHDQGFEILGFPCNQFKNQEPGDNSEIQSFCQLNYGVSFPLFAKVDVNGDNAIDLYQFLKQQSPGVLGTQSIKWNFTKFLIDKKGQVLNRFAPATKPEQIKSAITTTLAA